jgi:hypothetical protein
MKGFQGWLQKHSTVLSITLLVFLFNQLFEFLHLYASTATYANLCDWDCGWYAGVVQNGYDLAPHAHAKADAANWAFFPSLPIVAAIIAKLSPWTSHTALLVTSKCFFFMAIFAFIRFTALYAPRLPTWVAACVVGLHPYAIYGNVGYTESMFLFFSCVSLIALRQQRFLTAGVAGAVLSAVRPTGVFILFAVLHAVVKQMPRTGSDERIRMLLAVMLVPLGLALFMWYLHFRVGDALAFSHVQIAWERLPSNPFTHLLNGLRSQQPLDQLCAWMSITALSMTAYLAWRREYGLALFALCATLIPLSTGLLAMPRYLWWQAPLLLVVAQFFGLSLQSLSQYRSRQHNNHLSISPHWWLRVPLGVIAIPLCLWGLSLMYQGWILREAFVI